MVIENSKIRQIIYNFLSAYHCKYRFILYHFSVIVVTQSDHYRRLTGYDNNSFLQGRIQGKREGQPKGGIGDGNPQVGSRGKAPVGGWGTNSHRS